MGGLRNDRLMGSFSFLPLLTLLPIPFILGCELDAVTLTEPENVIVAEVYLSVGDGDDELFAFLQSTLGSTTGTNLRQAVVEVTAPDGTLIPLLRGERGECLTSEILDDVDGFCFVVPDGVEGVFAPGDRAEVSITLPDGRRIYGGLLLPGDFSLFQPAADGVCALPPGQPLEMIWTSSEEAWAYIGETLIWGLQDALRPLGVELEDDSLSLVGLSISETDTTLVFPAEFGVFDRFDLNNELALALQDGLPLGAQAEVAIAAIERNHVNWVRGGNFNPSGAVRIPSLRGDGTGVFGGAVRRVIRVVGAFPQEVGLPNCLPGG